MKLTKPIPGAAPEDVSRYYGAPCLPTVRGLMWECRDRAEYLQLRAAYEECEGNCNTCRHLVRTKHDKQPGGYLLGTCGRDGRALRFHPEDPMHMPCWETRR